MLPNAPYERAVALCSEGRYADSIPLFDEGLSLEPGRARLHSNRGIALCRVGRHGDARRSVMRGVELRGADAYPLVIAARVLDAEQDESGARALAEEAWAERADLESGHVEEVAVILAYAMNKQGVWREALRVVDEGLALFPSSASLLTTRATTLAHGEQWGEAMRAIDRALALDSNNAFILERRATIIQGLAVVETALAAARAGTPGGSTSWQAWHELGVALWMNGDALAAADAFDRARKYHPDESQRTGEAVALSPWEVDCRLSLVGATPAEAQRKAATVSAPERSIGESRRAAKAKPARKSASARPAPRATHPAAKTRTPKLR